METTLASQSFPWTLDQSYDLKLQVRDREIRALVNGKPMFQFHDSSDDVLTGGGIALVVDTGSVSTPEVHVAPL